MPGSKNFISRLQAGWIKHLAISKIISIKFLLPGMLLNHIQLIIKNLALVFKGILFLLNQKVGSMGS